MSNLYLPALRGVFGDWIYYSCLMSLSTLSERVDFADVIHKSSQLSDLIQREIKKKRAIEIADYLNKEKQRFFSSLVLAVYGGDAVWLDIGIISAANPDISVDEISESTEQRIGFLCLTGNEQIFAIDGQHRLAGIKQAIETNPDLGNDEVSVILVGHKKTSAGLQRTRRLFTTLNKTAQPVSKGEIIALDENDVMAIIVRRLVEEHPYFTDTRILFRQTNNLPAGDFKSLTTIGNLYDLLGILFSRIESQVSLKKLQYSRPTDERLGEYYEYACYLFDLLRNYVKEIDEFFSARNYPKVVRKYRGESGGSVFFRPIGLTIMMEVIGRLCTRFSLEESVAHVAQLPRQLGDVPYAGVLWNINTRTMVNKNRVLTRNLLLYMLGEKVAVDKLKKDYKAVLGQAGNVDLPPQI